MINKLSINFTNRTNEGSNEERCDILVITYILSTIGIFKGSLSKQGVVNDVKFFSVFLDPLYVYVITCPRVVNIFR